VTKLRETIQHNDVEGGVFQLVTNDGETYELEGAADAGTHVGQKVEVDGTVDKNAMSFTMTGPRLKVRSLRRL
jgi:hypothetical protein